jgi:WD40 repeat protein
MLSGHDPSESPFRFPPLQEPDLAKIGALIAQMVQLDADLRPASMAAVRQELERLAAETANSQHSSGQIVVPGPPQAPAAAPRASVVLPRSAHAPGLSAAYARSVLPTYKGHTGRVNALAWSPDGTRIVSGSADKAVRVWDVATGKTLWTYRASLKRVLAVAWSPDGGRIAVGGGSLLSSWWRNAALVLDAGTGKTVLKYSAHTGWVRAVAWSPDGTSVASVGGMLSRSGDIVEVWNAASGSTIATYTRHGNKIDALAWSPDGTRIASGGSDATVQVWDAATAQPLLTCRVYGWVARFRTWLQVRAIAWSPDGTRIASAGGQTVQVWEADAQKPAGTRSWVHFGIRAVRIWENDQPLLVYHGHRQKVLAVAWSPDALHLASGSDDGTVHVWDASTGKLIFSYGGHTGPVSAVAWSPDGRWIASGGADATVQVWDAR